MPQALLSVSDKTGIVEFASGLVKNGWTLIASGSTAKTLRENNLPVTDVSDYTQSPEMLGGRVKTLHPAIHAGLLARDNKNDHQELLNKNWNYIDLVAVNLYPFEKTIAQKNVSLEDAIENIDIGGVALIRAAAKNHQRVTLVCDPMDYSKVLAEINQGSISTETRKELAIKGFAMTSHYDAAITNFFAPNNINLTLYPVQQLRYGENPHQAATLYSFTPNGSPLGGKLLQGKELSYNNLLDLDAAWRTVVSFSKPTICIVKHLSPCGIASDDNLSQAFRAALASDPVSAFGGIIASNQLFDTATANALENLFVEAIIAPGFSAEALEILAKRTQCRLLEMPLPSPAFGTLSQRERASLLNVYEWRSIQNGLLKQDLDQGDPQNVEWKIVSQRQPTATEWESLQFAWRACQPVKSNAIVFAQGEATVGIGGGQPNRVDCVRMAGERAGEKSRGAVMASDAFFPFADSIEIAAQFGITAVIHPGGSKRDAEVIAAADKAGMAMVITGVRHFRH
jgi:phosphoribosylaminoimidazolecarboxamide formyltransferase/IMP cyclohydrolase